MINRFFINKTKTEDNSVTLLFKKASRHKNKRIDIKRECFIYTYNE
jgi:hypothetical protein